MEKTKTKKPLILLIPLFCSFFFISNVNSVTALPQLEIVGTNIQYLNGTQIWLKGVNIPAIIWWYRENIDQTEIGYVGSWNCNLVVLSHKINSPDDPTPEWDKQAYKDLLEDIVEWNAQEGIYTWIKAKPTATTSELGTWTETDWTNWKNDLAETAKFFVDNGLSSNVIYTPVTEPNGLTSSQFQSRMRQCIDAIRSEDPNAPIIIHALDMYGGIGLFTEQDYPIDRNNTGFAYHDHWWRTDKGTSKATIRTKRQNVGATWCLENNRAVFCDDFNYDANVGTDGEIWLTNFFEVMQEAPYEFAGWAHWGWMTPEDDAQNWGEITAYGTGNPTTQGAIVQEFLPDAPISPPTGIPFEDRFETGTFDKWNETDTSGAGGSTFGKNIVVGSEYQSGLLQDIWGTTFNSGGVSGSATSISWYGRGRDTATGDVKCAIYDSSNNLLAESNKLAIGSTVQWNTHIISCSISASTDYKLAVWFERGTARFYRETAGSQIGFAQYDYGDPNGFPDPLVPTAKYGNFSIYVTVGSTGDAYKEISSTSYEGAYSANFTTSTTDNAYALAEVYFADTYECLNLRSWVYFDSLPDSGDALSVMQFLNSSGDWISDLKYQNVGGLYQWNVTVYNVGGNLHYVSNQTLTVQTWNNVEFHLNITGQVKLWINETEKISETGDYNDRGEIKKTQIRLENIGTQSTTKTVLHDYVRVDDERIYGQTAILFFSAFALDEYGGTQILSDVTINDTYTTNNEGEYSWANLAYNQIHVFTVKRSQYYPAWIIGANSFFWDGISYVISYNLTETNHYIQTIFQTINDIYVRNSTAKITNIVSSASYVKITANDVGTKTIVLNVGNRGSPDLVSGASYTFSNPLLTLSVSFSSSKTITMQWLDEATSPTDEIAVYFLEGHSLGFQSDDKTIILAMTSGNLNSSEVEINADSAGGSFRFTSNETVTIKITFTFNKVQVSGDQGNALRRITSGSSFIFSTGNNGVVIWDVGYRPLFPLRFLLGMTGLLSMSGGSIYATMQIKRKEYFGATRNGAIFIALGFAFFLAWLW